MFNKREIWEQIRPLLITAIICTTFFCFIYFLVNGGNYITENPGVENNKDLMCDNCKSPCDYVRIPIFDQGKQTYVQINEMKLCNVCKSLILIKIENIEEKLIKEE